MPSIKTISINTRYKDSAGARVCVHGLSKHLLERGFDVRIDDWDNYSEHDVILFMAPDSDVIRAKQENPRALVGIMDPKFVVKKRDKTPEMRAADFLLVSSIEQREALLPYNSNIVVYYMFPETPGRTKHHTDKETIAIGYHGNKLHLHNFFPELNDALDRLSEKHPVELHAIYNVEALGKWSVSAPSKIPIKHIQWTPENCDDHIHACDIGIVPNLISINRKRGLFATQHFWKVRRGYDFRYTNHDFLTRYKYSTNPGRIYVFSQLGVPVVSDLAPSSCQIIRDGTSGYIAHGSDGWYQALETLLLDAKLRQKMADNLRDTITQNFSVNQNVELFIQFIHRLKTT